eukprot:Nitzschia sp. Nitz4//scaffold22_size323478//273209//275650//NITZ4_000579-RA/size323478-processed-gene-0.484-mRNA-1//-1//CDS//3329543153//7544//frame0
MWGNLDKLASPGWKASLQKLGNAVAPPPDDDQGDSEEEYLDDEEEYEDDEEYDEDENSQGGGFGFVGLLSRALENNADDEEGSEEEELEEDQAEDYVESVEEHQPQQWESPQALEAKETTSAFGVAEASCSSDVSNDPVSYPTENVEEPIEGVISAGIKPSVGSNQTPQEKNPPSPEVEVEEEEETFDWNVQEDFLENTAETQEVDIATEVEQKSALEVLESPQRESDTPQEPDYTASETVEFPPTAATPEETVPHVENAPQELVEEVPGKEVVEPLPVVEVVEKPAIELATETKASVPNPVETEIAKPQEELLPATDSVSHEDLSAARQAELLEAKNQIQSLQQQLEQQKHSMEKMQEKMMTDFHDKELRLLQASAEEHQQELLQTQHTHQGEIQTMEMRMATERSEFVKTRQQLQEMVEQCNLRAESAEADLRTALRQHENELIQSSQQENRTLRKTEDKLAQTLALLDERNDEISRLKTKMKQLESSMNEHAEGVEEAEQEVEELQTENEGLHDQVESLEAQCLTLKGTVSKLEDETRKIGALQMELTMLREERDRERMKNQSSVTSHSQVAAERDEALSQVRDLKQQILAAQADLEIVRSDNARILTANANLQSALEAFQDERQAEMDLGDQQRKEAEEALKSAHAATLEIAEERHAETIRKIQDMAEKGIQEVKNELESLKVRLQKEKSENGQLRRSLDEAIHRLQTTQEDVVDRTLMKNILLDWCTMKDKEKRHQVLQLMASVLHFTEDEKESVHLTHMDIDSVRAKVVGALAAPIPPSKADVERLEGKNVSEKWVSFLLAETDDGF